jgi:5-methylcytosine-specific restriction endonuclease McrA
MPAKRRWFNSANESQRICITPRCRNFCVPGRSRCRECGGGAWARVPKARTLAYADPTYRRNRVIAIQREPECHWRLPGCTLKSTTADHLLSVAKGGSHELENLVGACASCNQWRGGAEGRETQKRRSR